MSGKSTNPWMIIGWIILAFVILSLGTCMYIASAVADATQQGAENDLESETSGSDKILVNGVPATFESAAVEVAPSAPPVVGSLAAKVIAFQCEESATGDYVITKLTIQNTGNVEIPYASSVVQLADASGAVLAVETGHFGSIPPGSIKTATTMSRNSGQITSCNYIAQDRRGNAIELQGK